LNKLLELPSDDDDDDDDNAVKVHEEWETMYRELWKGDEDLLKDSDDEDGDGDEDDDEGEGRGDKEGADKRYVPRAKQALLALKLGENADDEEEKEELIDRAREEDPGLLVGWKIDLAQWMGGKGFVLGVWKSMEQIAEDKERLEAGEEVEIIVDPETVSCGCGAASSVQSWCIVSRVVCNHGASLVE
jgi:hypothetical protein